MRWCHFNYWRHTRVSINCNHSKPMLRCVSVVETTFTQICATKHRENLESKMNGYDVHVRWYKNLAIRHIFFFELKSHFNSNIPICAPSTVLSMSKFYVEINVSNFISRSLNKILKYIFKFGSQKSVLPSSSSALHLTHTKWVICKFPDVLNIHFLFASRIDETFEVLNLCITWCWKINKK
jgi:hypothetical protein